MTAMTCAFFTAAASFSPHMASKINSLYILRHLRNPANRGIDELQGHPANAANAVKPAVDRRSMTLCHIRSTIRILYEVLRYCMV